MDEKQYNELCEIELNKILAIVEEIDQEGNCEADLINGVLSIILPDQKEYVINKHLPTKKIWMASPFTGPDYFKYDEINKEWVNNKNISIIKIVREEITNI